MKMLLGVWRNALQVRSYYPLRHIICARVSATSKATRVQAPVSPEWNNVRHDMINVTSTESQNLPARPLADSKHEISVSCSGSIGVFSQRLIELTPSLWRTRAQVANIIFGIICFDQRRAAAASDQLRQCLGVCAINLVRSIF